MWPTQRILLVSTVVLLVATAGFGSYYLQTSSTISMLQSQISNQSATLSKLMGELHQLQTNESQSSAAISAELATLSTAVNGLGSQSTQQQILIQAIKSEISSLDDLVSKQVGGNISLLQSQVNALAGVFLGCAGSTPVNYVQPNAQQIRPVLLLKPNSTANVCVTYQTNWSLGIMNYSFYHQNFFPNGTYRFGVAIFKTTKG